MTKSTKRVLIALGIAAGAWLVFGVVSRLASGAKSITDAIRGTIEGTKTALLYPFSSVASAVTDAASLPAAADQSAALDASLASLNGNDYAPGGRIYNNIASAQGVAAADAAWATVQEHQLAQEADTRAWWQIWK